MEIALNILRGKYGLAKTFWLFWFIPSILIGILLSPLIYIPFLIELNNKSYLLAAAIAIAVPVLYILYNIIMIVASWNAASLYSGLKIWPILAKIYVLVSVLALSYGIYAALQPDDITDRTSSTALPFEGYWQTSCSHNSGILIMYAGGTEFSIQFCSGEGCSDPGKYKPNTSIINDPDYEIIDDTHMKIKDHFGFRTYTLCQTLSNP